MQESSSTPTPSTKILKWKRRKFKLLIGRWVEADCVGAWSYHQEQLESGPKKWQISHVTTGRLLCWAQEEDAARKIVQFLAARWYRPHDLSNDRAKAIAIHGSLDKARESQELHFFHNWEVDKAQKAFEAQDLEKQLIAALLVH